MWFFVLLLGTAFCAPADEFRNFVHNGELSMNDEAYVMQIVPSGYPTQKTGMKFGFKLTDFIDKNSDSYKTIDKIVKQGDAMKGLTFSIHDDKLREAAIALFRILQDSKKENIKTVYAWVKSYINEDIFDYAIRIAALYNNNINPKELLPPFMYKPNYFINSETIVKAWKLKLNNGLFSHQEAQVNQFYLTNEDTIVINTNYSGWNYQSRICEKEINYFREDISLNSYYYGLHLLHPFWMTNDELDEVNQRHAEHYLFAHKQLLSRYYLEKQHLEQQNLRGNVSTEEECDWDYYPFLLYDNGLPFPSRPGFFWKDNVAINKVQSIDIALKECISRKVLMMENGSVITITEDNYLQLLPKLIRANLDGVKSAKTIRDVFTFLGGYPTDQYNPAPSVLHHPETSLRDALYFRLIERALNYSYEFINSMEPYDLSLYETNTLVIVDKELDSVTSFFDNYQININKLFSFTEDVRSMPQLITARQMRLQHIPFTFTFKIDSFMDQNVAVRLFLGPQCDCQSCWHSYDRFFELDSYKYKLTKGINNISWSPDTSLRYSSDAFYNIESNSEGNNRFNMFKFPENLVIPKGLEEGLNLTLFVMLTPYDETLQVNNSYSSDHTLYDQVTSVYEADEKPLGFPFHRMASNVNEYANNYKFYNISIFHHHRTINKYGHFSSYLY